MFRCPNHIASVAVISLLFSASPKFGWAQGYTKSDRELVQQMLRNVASDVQKYYYDQKFHEVEWDATVRRAKEGIDKADSLNVAISEIAAALDSLHDSHTFFIPPPRTYDHDYGFNMQMVGDHCYVVRVRSSSDAEKKASRSEMNFLR